MRPDRWEQIYREEFPSIYRAVLAVVRDRDTALDALHDAFCEGLRKPPPDDRSLQGWLFRVAIRQASRSRLRRRFERLLWIDAPSEETEEFDAVLDRLEVLRLLQRLSERQRAMVIAEYYLGLDQSDIAEMFGVRRGTVSATLAQARARMRLGGPHA